MNYQYVSSFNKRIDDVQNHFSIFLYEKMLALKKKIIKKEPLRTHEVLLEMDKLAADLMVSFADKFHTLKRQVPKMQRRIPTKNFDDIKANTKMIKDEDEGQGIEDACNVEA